MFDLKSFIIKNNGLTYLGAFFAGFIFHHRMILGDIMLSEQSNKVLEKLNHYGYWELVFMPLLYAVYIVSFLLLVKIINSSLTLIFTTLEEIINSRVKNNLSKAFKVREDQVSKEPELDIETLHKMLQETMSKIDKLSEQKPSSGYGLSEVKDYIHKKKRMDKSA